MAGKTKAPAVEAAGDMIPTEVIAAHPLAGITFRPGIVYQADAATRAKLETAGVLKKD